MEHSFANRSTNQSQSSTKGKNDPKNTSESHILEAFKSGVSTYINIPILPEAFLTFASKSSVRPSYVANGQEDQCLGVLRNVHGQDCPLQNKF